MRLTAKSAKEPIIRLQRRPMRSTMLAEMMVPMIPMVLMPPAKPDCVIEL